MSSRGTRGWTSEASSERFSYACPLGGERVNPMLVAIPAAQHDKAQS